MNRLLGNEGPDPEVLTILRERLKEGQRWAAYQNHAMDSASLGHLQFLKVSPGCTFQTAPERMPDSPQLIGWPYLHVGFVNLETGQIEEAEAEGVAHA
jgi:hypothetical protein